MNRDWERMKKLLALRKGQVGEGRPPEPPSPDPQIGHSGRGEREVPPQLVEQETPYGRFLLRELEFPRSYVYGNTPLEWLVLGGEEGRALLGKDSRLAGIEPSSLLFLDLETTGLGGAGAYAFLVGLGFFRSDHFYIRQYFMRDFSEEKALLSALRDFLSVAQGVVSYNGKMFDLPFLSDRFILNRMQSPLEGLPHLDLLHPARRLWRERMGSCSLVHLEENLLGMRRVGDVPSELIPNLYFRYLQCKDPAIVQPVFSHNVRDLLSLMALKARACCMIEDPQGFQIEHGLDYYCLAKLFEDLGHWERGIACYECALQQELPSHVREEARHRLSLIWKRAGDRPRAVRIWQDSIGEDAVGFDFFSCEELAKHKEHHEKDYQGAILIVNQALERLALLDFCSPPMKAVRTGFEHRLRRLQHKQRGERWY